MHHKTQTHGNVLGIIERQIWWAETPVVRIVYAAWRRIAPPKPTPVTKARSGQTQALFHDWTPTGLTAHDESVEVYSNCGEVTLSLNGKSLGAQNLPPDAAPRAWHVAFESGATAAACKEGPREELRTANKASKTTLSIDRSRIRNDSDDVAYVAAPLTDDFGLIVPQSAASMTFRIMGAGMIAAVDSADNTSHEPFQSNSRHAYDGSCVAVIRASVAGKIAVTASAPGLSSATVSIEAQSK